MDNINIKSKEEIDIMRCSGGILARVLNQVVSNIKPGVSELDLDGLAEKLIISQNAEPGFKKVEGYKHTICVSTNEVVVHGIPTGYRFKKGDVVGVDCGVYYKGFHTDMAETVLIPGDDPKDNAKKARFLQIGKNALNQAIAVAISGARIGNISEVIQRVVEKQGGFSVVRSLIGHGVGKQLHEEPEVPGFLAEPIDKTALLIPGMTIAVEVIYNMGTYEVKYAMGDGWTIKTADNLLSGLFERTILISKKGPEILTKE